MVAVGVLAMGADGFDFFVHGGIGLGAGGGRGRGLGRRGRHGESRVGLMSTVKGTGLRLATRRQGAVVSLRPRED